MSSSGKNPFSFSSGDDEETASRRAARKLRGKSNARPKKATAFLERMAERPTCEFTVGEGDDAEVCGALVKSLVGQWGDDHICVTHLEQHLASQGTDEDE